MFHRWLIIALVLLMLGGGYAVMQRGARLEDRILRTGGQAIQMLTQRPRRTIIGFVGGVSAAWGGVLIFSALELRRKRRDATCNHRADGPDDESASGASATPSG